MKNLLTCRIFQSLHLLGAVILSTALFSGSGCAAPADGGFVLQDFLNRTWRNEAVRYPLSAAQLQQAKAAKSVVAPGHKPVAFQLIAAEGKQPAAIEFLTDLDPFEKRAYQFDKTATAPATDLKIEESATAITMGNSVSGVIIRKKLEVGQGPIAGIRLKSGKVIGGSGLDPEPELKVTEYSAKVLARGPVYSEIECNVGFENGGKWQVNFRQNANEPVILVDENMALGDKVQRFAVYFNQNFTPDKIFYRAGSEVPDGGLGKNIDEDLALRHVYVMEPWLHWARRTDQGMAVSFYNSAGTDLVSVGAREASAWVDPGLPADQRAEPTVYAKNDPTGLHMDFALRNGARKWMITALDKDASLDVMQDPKLLVSSPLPFRYLIKHGHFPLNKIKDYVLQWNGDHENYPRTLINRKQAAQFRASQKDKTVYDAAIAQYLKVGAAGDYWRAALKPYFATGNKEVGQKLIENAISQLQVAVDDFLQQPYDVFGSAPHRHYILGKVPLLADAALSVPGIEPETRQRILAQLAFLAYTVDRPDYWSPARGFAANPNMTTSVYGYKTILAGSVSSHPKAVQWSEDGMNEMRRQRDEWSDSNGGWLEAPHYAMVSFDIMLSSFVVAKNAGWSDELYDPKLKKVSAWFSKISTPRDPRFTRIRPDAEPNLAGFRHWPPIGNTYVREPSGEFGIVAYLWKEKDPAFASEMQWMYQQHGSFGEPGVGGDYPAFAGYREILTDPTIPAKVPNYKSELFPETGVILRSHYADARENQLYLIAGKNHAHYDHDSGSVTLWAKGRIIADDWGYTGQAPTEDASLLDVPGLGAQEHMQVTGFTSSDDFDYVSGTRAVWQRQIGFVKDADPLGPNYFVFRDTAQTDAPGTLRWWLAAAKVTPRTNAALVEGHDDVDTDIIFATPNGIELGTEEKTRSTAGYSLEGAYVGKVSTTQTGLIAKTPANGGVLYVVYPRLKTQAAPEVTSLADGKAVRVKSTFGTDWVFLSDKPFSFKEGSISFEGTSGLVKIRGDKATITLGAPGKLSARDQSITK